MWNENYIYINFVFVASSLIALISFVAFLMGCVCGCRRKVPKNELLGLAGMVKIRNPDDQISNSHIPCSNEQINATKSLLKRINGGTATRSLPDLPVDQKWSQASGGEPADTNSELYATVEDGQLKAGNAQVEEPVAVTPSQNSGNSVNPYLQLNASAEHPYAQLDEPGEHRYARVGEGGSIGPRPSASSTPSSGTPPSRRSCGEGSGAEERIPAASAIAGTVPANRDLPYMTPPIAPQPSQQQQPPQPHFSGDSQDSAKGYTSISVREPLSRILVKDAHYSTVSDVDSDDMYAAIEDRRGNSASGSDTYARIGAERREYPGSDTYARIGPGGPEPLTPGDYATSGSETYAQIGPRQSSLPEEACAVGSDMYAQIGPRQSSLPEESGDIGLDMYAQIAPRNSSITASAECLETYGQVAPTHARQESWSSVSPGSPRKEKREANSPLPEPPSDISPLDAMYAKVIKKQRSPPDQAPVSLPTLSTSSQVNGEILDPKYETVKSLTDMTLNLSHYETVQGELSLPGPSDDPPYERLHPSPKDIYAQVNKGESSKSPNKLSI